MLTAIGKAVEAGLKTLDLSEKQLFITWYLSEHQKAEDLIATEQQKLPRLTAAEYITALKAIKFDDISSVAKFHDLTSELSYRPSAEPVRLGVQDKLQYFIQPQLDVFDMEFSTNEKTEDLHPYFVQFKSSIGTTPLIQFGLHLGMLQYTTESDTKGAFLRKTPLHLFVHPMQLPKFDAYSIWLVLDRTFNNEQAGLVKMAERENSWSWCGLKTTDRPPFDCIRIFTGREVQASTEDFSNRQSELFNSKTLGTAQVHCLQAQPATKQQVENAMSSAIIGA